MFLQLLFIIFGDIPIFGGGVMKFLRYVLLGYYYYLIGYEVLSLNTRLSREVSYARKRQVR